MGDSDDMLRVATMLDTVQEGIEQVYLERVSVPLWGKKNAGTTKKLLSRRW